MITLEKVYPKVKDALDVAEEARLKALSETKIYKYILYVVSTGSIIWFFIDPKSIGLTIFLIVGAAVLWFIKRSNKAKKLKEFFQKTVLPKLIEEMGSEYSYSANGKISEEDLNKSQLVESFNQYKSEDLITGKIDGRTFQYCEVSLSHKSSRTGEESRTSHVFSGIFVVSELTATSPANLYLYPAIFKGLLNRFRSSENFQQLDLKNEVFNQSFCAFSENPETAKQLLRETIQQKIVEINNKFKNQGFTATDVLFSFVENKIYMAITTSFGKGIMNPTLKNPLNTSEFLKPQIDLINSIHSVAATI